MPLYRLLGYSLGSMLPMISLTFTTLTNYKKCQISSTVNIVMIYSVKAVTVTLTLLSQRQKPTIFA